MCSHRSRAKSFDQTFLKVCGLSRQRLGSLVATSETPQSYFAACARRQGLRALDWRPLPWGLSLVLCVAASSTKTFGSWCGANIVRSKTFHTPMFITPQKPKSNSKNKNLTPIFSKKSIFEPHRYQHSFQHPKIIQNPIKSKPLSSYQHLPHPLLLILLYYK